MNTSSVGSIPARAAALLLDCIILIFPQLLFGHIFGTLFINRFGYTDPTMIALGYNLWAGLIAIIISWMYFAGFESSPLQATIGKKAFGLVVVTVSGARLSFQRASGRYFARILSGICFGIGYIMAAFSARRQALHDVLAKTLVLSRIQRSSISVEHDVGMAAPVNIGFYEMAQSEVDSNNMIKGIYAQAFERHPENEALRTACYISLRVNQLSTENNSRYATNQIQKIILNIKNMPLKTLLITLSIIFALLAVGVYGFRYWYSNIYWSSKSDSDGMYIEFKDDGRRGQSRHMCRIIRLVV